MAVPSTAGPIEIVLPRGGVLVGRVLDANGEPLANATVTVGRPRPEPPARAGGPALPQLPRFIMAGPGGLVASVASLMPGLSGEPDAVAAEGVEVEELIATLRLL